MTSDLRIFTKVDFATERLDVASWDARLSTPFGRAEMLSDLQRILTPKVTVHLPPYLHVDGSKAQVTAAMDHLRDESAVSCVVERSTGALAGLLVVGQDPQATEPLVFIGYLLDEPFWGKGLATELLRGLVKWTQDQGWQGWMLGGVETDNPASAAVLRKVGFTEDRARSGPDTVMFGREFAGQPS
jgi:RimJ/RimL family protein N-acetyltransferase